MQEYDRVLTIAGSDSGGGAGIQADLKTFAALGCYGMSAITCLTAQNTEEVRGVHPVPASFVVSQIEAVLDDIGADAVKIGMLYSADIISAVADCLERYGVRTIVLDPVMVAKSGDRLLQAKAISALRRDLIPKAEVFTPNLPEAEELLGRKICCEAEMESAVRDLAALGPKAVLLKGGHFEGASCVDLLYLRERDFCLVLEGQRVNTGNTHGTGCTLSSAIAAFLSKGLSIEDAAKQAKDFVAASLEAGAHYQIGRGKGPPHHFFRCWQS